jgi:hypothetical protein
VSFDLVNEENHEEKWLLIYIKLKVLAWNN